MIASVPTAERLARINVAIAQRRMQGGSPDDATWATNKRAELLSACFPKQRAFIEDPHKAKAALCTRRAGKTYGVALAHYLNLLDGRNGAYIAPTAKQARRLMWNGRAGLKAVARRFGLDVDFNNTEMIATLRRTGANVMLGGAETRDDCEKYRGEALGLVTIDEPSSIKEHLEYLIDDVLEPTLLDEDGTLALVGSPGRVLAGPFYAITSGDAAALRTDEDSDDVEPEEREAALARWAVHRWSLHDNPFLKKAARFLARIFRRHGWDPANPPPRAQREYGGLWVREGDTLVYKFSADRNVFAVLPRREDWEYGLAVDIGSVNATAFRIIAYSPKHPIAYGIEGKKEAGLDITAIAERIKGTRHMATYTSEYTGPIIEGYAERYRLRWLVMDSGALGKMIVQEINQRHLLSPQAEPAEKKDKQDFIDLFNDDLLQGRFKVKADDPVIPEWTTLQWAEDKAKRQEDPRQANDLSDATLYGWRRAKHYYAQAQEPKPTPGTAEAFNAQAAEWEARERAEVERETGRGKSAWWDR